MNRSSYAWVVLAMVAGLGPVASAAPVTWRITGQINGTGVFQTFAIGQPFVVTVTFDDTAPDTNISPAVGEYAFDSLKFDYKDGEWVATDLTGNLQIWNNNFGVDGIYLYIEPPGDSIPQAQFNSGGFVDMTDILITLQDGAAAEFSSTAIPTPELVDLSAFDDGDFQDGLGVTIRRTSTLSPTGSIQTFSTAVPVPATLPAGLLFLAALAMRRSNLKGR